MTLASKIAWGLLAVFGLLFLIGSLILALDAWCAEPDDYEDTQEKEEL